MSDSLSDEERLDRIGAILAIGIGRLLLSRPPSEQPEHPTKNKSKRANSSQANYAKDDILNFIARVRTVSPAEIRTRFRLSRTTAYRRLRALEKNGLIKRSGSSRGTTYEFAA